MKEAATSGCVAKKPLRNKGRGLPQDACYLQPFEQQGIIALERIRIEVLQQQAKTAIASGDPEQGSAYIDWGGNALGSQRRYNEIEDTFKQ